MEQLTHLTEGMRIFRASQKRKRSSFRRYEGDADAICSQIVKDCWNGSYFQVSNGNFPEFYTRDFGWCVDALLKLGYKKEVRSTLAHAMKKFAAAGRISVAITPKGKVFDFPAYAVDSLPYFLHALHAAKMTALVKEHRDFLESELEKFHSRVLAENGMVRADMHFSSMKDHAKRVSSCYDNSMAAMLKERAKALKLKNPLQPYNYKKLVKQELWRDGYFLDDISGKTYVAGDANLFPFWTGLYNNRKMMKSAFSAVVQAGLDKPFPLLYNQHDAPVRLRWFSFLAPKYEQNVAWMHMGPLFVNLMKKIDPQKHREYAAGYKLIIEHYGTLLEGYFSDGRPYRSPFYAADEGLLWAANMLV